MAAKRDLTDPQVQGHRPTKDPLDKLVAIAIRVAEREGLVQEGPPKELEASRLVERGSDDRRST